MDNLRELVCRIASLLFFMAITMMGMIALAERGEVVTFFLYFILGILPVLVVEWNFPPARSLWESRHDSWFTRLLAGGTIVILCALAATMLATIYDIIRLLFGAPAPLLSEKILVNLLALLNFLLLWYWFWIKLTHKKNRPPRKPRRRLTVAALAAWTRIAPPPRRAVGGS